ncbi:MAG: 30S ribosomal protein S21 [Candidatus Melainabacteria bacterium]|nr:30S ribosomal protein S21 [Candidatus Melainabacteria bacterium]
MSEVKIEDGESLESALKRFKKKVQKAGILTEVRRREHYEKKSFLS